MPYSITVRNVSYIQQAVQMAIPKALSSSIMLIGWDTLHRVAKVPGKVKHPILWKSAKQRRFYFAMRYRMEEGRVSAGNIRRAGMGSRSRLRMRKASKFIPYRRGTDPNSQNLVNGWRVDRRGAMMAEVNNPVPYASFVQSEDWQQPFHRNTGWITERRAAEKMVRSGTIAKIFTQELKRKLGSLVVP